MAYTIKQLQKKDSKEYMSDKLLLTTLINERINGLTQVSSPLSKRLTDLRKKVEDGTVFQTETEGQKTYFIEISGQDEGDIEAAIDECKKKIMAGFSSGFDSNDTGSYSFESKGWH